MMNDIAMAAMEMSSARVSAQYAISLQKKTMTDMEQQALGELEIVRQSIDARDKHNVR